MGQDPRAPERDPGHASVQRRLLPEVGSPPIGEAVEFEENLDPPDRLHNDSALGARTRIMARDMDLRGHVVDAEPRRGP